MKTTANDIRSWACRGACAYLATTHPDGVEVDEAFLRRWAAGGEWGESHWTDLARAAAQVDPSIVFAIANMALEYAARLNPSLVPFVGTVVDKSSSVEAAEATRAATEAAAQGAETAPRAAGAAASMAAWAARDAALAAADAAWAARAAARAADAAAGMEGEARERIIALCIATILKENV